jgi:hypothetical protein
MSKSKKELDELLALKKLNMLRLSKFEYPRNARNARELEFANRLDEFLSKELGNKGVPMATHNTLKGLLINQNALTCEKSNYGTFTTFQSNKRREGELEMLESMNEIYEKELDLISEQVIPENVPSGLTSKNQTQLYS